MKQQKISMKIFLLTVLNDENFSIHFPYAPHLHVLSHGSETIVQFIILQERIMVHAELRAFKQSLVLERFLVFKQCLGSHSEKSQSESENENESDADDSVSDMDSDSGSDLIMSSPWKS